MQLDGKPLLAEDVRATLRAACAEHGAPCPPDVIVASAVLDVPAAFVYMARLVQDKKFTPHVYWLGMKENIVSLVWNDKLKATMKPETVKEVERVEQDIRSGKFEVPRGKF